MMTLRSEPEMTALLSTLAQQIGPLEHWSDQALEVFNLWLKNSADGITHEWVKRDSNSEADC